MSNIFWIAASLLIMLALAFVLYPVFFHRSGQSQQLDQRNQNLLAYRSRMQELDAEYEAGVFDKDNYEQLKTELGGSMLDDIPENETPVASTPGRKTGMAVALLSILAIPALTLVLYERWGAMDQVEQFITMEQLGGGDDAGREQQMASLAAQLQAKLEASPDNPDGWAMLGQTYMRMEKYPQAAQAFQQLEQSVGRVGGDDPSRALALGLAGQAMFFQYQGAMNAEVQQVITSALDLDPNEVNALGLLGISAFGQENYREAIGFWQRIVQVAPDHPQRDSIEGGILEAYNRLGETPPESLQASIQASSQPPAQALKSDGPGVTVSVSLDETFWNDVPADTTLFVFARQANVNSGAPLAVARFTAADMPLEIRLDDSMAMSPQNTISSVETVMVTARLSPSSSVMARAGDWQGSLAAPATVAAGEQTPLTLVINSLLIE
ncbi:c-type cytochrome biogenesis protein CcmI [Marinobacter sp. BSs20148]|jgi:cytochrome c-type biogenesis protein CcmH|uniref:c-type cytochrome biogenesis protein CcmI n=1 Tax=Marinobacter TaxID=2742 RepID=UPI0002776DA0|nr:c-type cytochrome biogenesis protein CcmI [Marinobacter sp. BSs20148]AFP29979.1 Cytochrome c-type biogenesis protein CycH [Marinobacter sp. BSs20148]